MKRKLLTTLLAILLALSMLGLFACTNPDNSSDNDGENTPPKQEWIATEGLAYELSEDETYYVCTGIGSATDSDIVIADTFNNLPVKSISEEAFIYCSSLESIKIPDGITSIGHGAFSECTNLVSVKIPDSVTNISPSVFYNCRSLESIIIPSEATSIGYYLFWGCNSLQSIIIGENVTSIGELAFMGCTSLHSITVESGNINYSSENGVLFNKDKTQLICYPISKAETNYIIPETVTSICNSAFNGCSRLESIIIQDGVTNLGYGTFVGCSSLKNIIIPDSVTCIDVSEFSRCTSLESITIPNTVTSIAHNAFGNCSNLESINYNGTKQQWKGISKENDWNSNTGNYTIHCTDGNLAKS